VGPALALASALSFGISDFAGGLAAKRTSPVAVTGLMQLTGLVVLVPALLLMPGAASVAALGLGAMAGLAGAAGLIAYLRGMAIGPMGVVSPLAALVGAALPVSYGVWLGEQLTPGNLAGVLLGLFAVVAVAYAPGQLAVEELRGPLLALLGGITFGLFFVLLDATPADSGMWPLLGARVAAALLVGAVWLRNTNEVPTRPAIRLAVLAGLLDMLANVLFLLAVRSDLLSLTSLLASLYPVVVVILARQLLAERLSTLQGVGVGAALAGTALIVL
jgi:drug/metabolite transporter (DMT)-like permease